MGKKNKDCLGRALIKDRFSKNRHRKHVENNTMLHTTEVNDGYEWGRLNLQSVTAESSLQEFISTAELAGREFTAEKLNLKYIKIVPNEVPLVTSQPDFNVPLTVPRRPKWVREKVSPAEQLQREQDSFLDWRRHMNHLEATLGAAVSPYERNLEVWRRLWITLDMSDILLILLDARNPLLFRCLDLEKYAAEQKCKCILLLNKADLTSEYQRKCWAEYFEKENVPIIFFSAAKNTKERKISEENDDSIKTNHIDNKSDSDTESEINSDTNSHMNGEEAFKMSEEDLELFKKQLGDLDLAVSKTADTIDKIQEALDKVLNDYKEGNPIEPLQSAENTNNENTPSVGKAVKNSHEILDRTRLIQVIRDQQLDNLKNGIRLTVGLVGYPNVGKSSTVNNLMQIKKVSVSSMPGHTRHNQTLMLDGDIELVDCPGLVSPAYAVTADLLLTAVLPIDQMCSYDAAMARLCQLVSKQTFEKKYGLLLPRGDSNVPDYKQILASHAYNRGFMTAAGQPDQSRSARLLLKDAATGRLHWEQLPPGTKPASAEDTLQETKGERRKPTPREARMVEGWRDKVAEIDKEFFKDMNKSSAHVKGKQMIGIVGAQPADGKGQGILKLSKKHANKNKREKLRRVYAHLDEN